MTTPSELKAQLDTVRFNPGKMQGLALRVLQDVSKGELAVYDPSNPFVFLMEAGATMASSIMTENANNNRKQYPKVAQTVSDLYRHMHYGEFNDIFALPGYAPFVLGFNKEELITRMVEVPGTEIRKIVIPRNTTITVGETVFSLQYPIELRIMGHGGIQVVYDVEKTTPLKTISTNVIEWQTVRGNDQKELVLLPLFLDQFSVITLTDTITAAQKFSLSTTITDQFYYCRVWQETTNQGWQEIQTTYSQDIYSNNKPTAIIKVDGKVVTVELPIVYVKTGQLTGKIRIDVYQTKGPWNLDLGGFDASQFIVNWNAIDKSEQDIYVAPLKAMNSVIVYSSGSTRGGRNAMTFDALKERVLQNADGNTIIPITPAQAQKRLERRGYNIVKSLDHVTDRVFAATRSMPSPRDTELVTAANAGIHTLSETVENLSFLSSAYQTNDGVTLSPKTLYRIDRGVLKVCSDAEIAFLDAMPGDKKAITITEGSYFYSPFHYVLDTSNNSFASRAYYLDSPTIDSRSFIAENDTTLLQVSTDSSLIRRTANGWELIVTTKSSQDWKDLMDEKVAVTLGFMPDASGDYAYILGEFIGRTDANERVYRFSINTSYDVDSRDQLQLTNAAMYEQTQQFIRCPLTATFDLFYSTSEPMGPSWSPVDFDLLVGTFLVPTGSAAISRERLIVNLGKALNNLWTRGRSVVGENDYSLWDVDVPAVYTADVYVRDPVTGIAVTIVDGEPVFNIAHHAGDPVLDGNGDPTFRYRVGDIKRDAYGQPIVVRGRRLTRQIDLFLLEAPYYFANNSAAIDYRKQLVDTVVSWISEDLKEIAKTLLDKTAIYFYPVQNVGSVDVNYGAGLKSTINAGQYFNLKLYVRDSVYKNEKLRSSLNRETVLTINEVLKSKTVSTSGIINALEEAYGDDVLSFEVEGLGGVAKLAICTMVDDSARLTIRKKLEYRADQTFALREDVNVEFISHERGNVELET